MRSTSYWWNYGFINFWKEWKQENVSKEKYLEVNKKAKKAVCQAECEAGRNRFEVFNKKDDHKCDVFKIPKRKFKTNQCVLAVSGDDKKLGQKRNPEQLLNIDFI